MILPTKHIPAQQSLLGVGAVLLRALRRDLTVSALWDEVRSNLCTFERFVLGLNLLYTLGLLELKDGLLRRTHQ